MKPIVRTMWLSIDRDGTRALFDTKPVYGNEGWSTDGMDWINIGSTKPPAHPEKSLKKVIVTIVTIEGA